MLRRFSFFGLRRWRVLEFPKWSAVMASVVESGGLLIEYNWHPHPQRVWGHFFTKEGALNAIRGADNAHLSTDLSIRLVSDKSRTILIDSFNT